VFPVVFVQLAKWAERWSRTLSAWSSGMLPVFCFRRSSAIRYASVRPRNLVGRSNSPSFPRPDHPASPAESSRLVDFCNTKQPLVILFGLMAWYGFWPTLAQSRS